MNPFVGLIVYSDQKMHVVGLGNLDLIYYPKGTKAYAIPEGMTIQDLARHRCFDFKYLKKHEVKIKKEV